MKNMTEIGKIGKTHGTNGELRLKIKDAFLEDVAQTDVLFVELQGKTVPFFIDHLRVVGGLLVAFEDIHDRDAALPLTGKKIFMRPSDMTVSRQPALSVSDLPAFVHFKGYTLIDKEYGVIGEILEVLSYPQQELAQVHYRGKEVLIPLHPALILQHNAHQKTLEVELPEGLLEL